MRRDPITLTVEELTLWADEEARSGDEYARSYVARAIRDVLQKRGQEYGQRCPYCHGSGFLQDGALCPMCDGVGYEIKDIAQPRS